MKTYPILVIASVTLNVALLALLFRSGADSPRRHTQADGRRQPVLAERAVTETLITDQPASWLWINHLAPEVFVSRLLIAGFPPAVVRALTHQRLEQIPGTTRDDPNGDKATLVSFRKTNSNGQHASRPVGAEQHASPYALLGSSAFQTDPVTDAYRRNLYGRLSFEKSEMLATVHRHYADLINEIHRDAKGILVANDHQRLNELEARKRSELIALLSQHELAEYDLRNSRTASHLRNELACLDVTEEQFRALFRLRQQHDAKHPGSGVVSLNEDTTAAERELITQMKAVLGEPLASEFERRLETNYRNVSLIVERLDLPYEAIQEVLEIRRAAIERSALIHAETADIPQDRRQQLADLARKTAAQVASILGPRGLEAYRHAGGSWVNEISRPTPAPGSSLTR